MYKDLRTLFHQDSSLADKTYQERFNSDYAHHLDININGGQAFYIVTLQIQKIIVDVLKQDKITFKLTHQLPAVAMEQYIKQCLIDEITSTNDIEGVYSSRKEINCALENLDKNNKDIKFMGLVKSYMYLATNNNIKFNDCYDIRKAYDELLLDDIINENPKNKPDGKLFRKDSVSVTKSGKDIHKGILPEEKIIDYVNKSLDYLNNYNDDPLLKAAVFHYLLGYIHPFYDGNGRLSRFITSWVFSKEYEPIVAFCFSLTVKKNLKKYYKAFSDCNHILNKGDLTPFVTFFLDMVLETFKSLNKTLKEKQEIYITYKSKIKNLSFSNNDKYYILFDLMLQATLFSEIGISTKDLLVLTATSRNTLRNRLNKIINKDFILINKIGHEKFYKFSNLSFLD